MTKVRADKIRSAAVSLLLKQKNLEGCYAICFLDFAHLITGRDDVSIGSYEAFCSKTGAEPLPDEVKGAAVKYGNMSYVFYDGTSYPSPDCFRTVLHELGHIILSHSLPPDKTQEDEAERFADEFLMPECVLRYLSDADGKALTPSVLTGYFPVTEADAERRTGEVLASHPHTLTHDEEILLIRLFGNIKKPKEKKENV